MALGDKLFKILEPDALEVQVSNLRKALFKAKAQNKNTAGGGDSFGGKGGSGKVGGDDVLENARVPRPDIEQFTSQVDYNFTKDGVMSPSVTLSLVAPEFLTMRGFAGWDARITPSNAGAVKGTILSSNVYHAEDGTFKADDIVVVSSVFPPLDGTGSRDFTVEVRLRNAIYGTGEWSDPLTVTITDDPNPPGDPVPVSWGGAVGNLDITLTPPTDPDYSHTEVYYGTGDFIVDDGFLVVATNKDKVVAAFDYDKDFLTNGYDTIKIRHIDNSGNATDLSDGVTITTEDAEATRILAPHIKPFAVQPNKLELGIPGFWPNGNIEVADDIDPTFPQGYTLEDLCAWVYGAGTSGPHFIRLGGNEGVGRVKSPFIHWTNFHQTIGAHGSKSPAIAITWDQAWTIGFGDYTTASLTVEAYDIDKNLLDDGIPVLTDGGSTFVLNPYAAGLATWTDQQAFLSATLPDDTIYVRFVFELDTTGVGDAINFYLDNFRSQVIDAVFRAYAVEFYEFLSGHPVYVGAFYAPGDGVLHYDNNIEVGGTISVGDSITATDIVATTVTTDTLTVHDSLSVEDDADITDTLTVHGTTTVEDLVANVSIQVPDLTVTNGASLSTAAADTLDITNASDSDIPLLIHSPSSQTGDFFQFYVGLVKTVWLTAVGVLRAPSAIFSGAIQAYSTTFTGGGAGTVPLLINAPSGLAVNLITTQVNGVNKFVVNNAGAVDTPGNITTQGVLSGASASITGAVTNASQIITNTTTSTIPLQIRGATGQTAERFSIQNTAGSFVFFSVQKDGFLGVGAAAQDDVGAFVSPTWSTDTAAHYGQRVVALKSVAGISSLYGSDLIARISATSGTQNVVYGMLNRIWLSAAAIITDGYASFNRLDNTGAGTITRGYALFVDTPVNSGGGSIGTAYGLYVANQNVASTNYAIRTLGGQVNFNSGATGVIPLTLDTPTGQTADLFVVKVNNVTKLKIDKDGAITQTLTSTGAVPLTVLAPTGQTALLMDAQVNSVSQFSVSASGALTVTGKVTGNAASFGTGTLASGTIDVTPSGTGTIGIQLHALSGHSVNLIEAFVNAVSKFLVDNAGNITSAGTFFKFNGVKHTSGSSLPGSPASGDKHFHTTYNETLTYDGTHWVGPEFPLSNWQYYVGAEHAAELTATQEYMNTALRQDLQTLVTRFTYYGYVNGTNSATNYWKIHLRTFTGAVDLQTTPTNTSTWAATTWTFPADITTFNVQPAINEHGLQIYVEKVTGVGGPPGPLRFYYTVWARNIYT